LQSSGAGASGNKTAASGAISGAIGASAGAVSAGGTAASNIGGTQSAAGVGGTVGNAGKAGISGAGASGGVQGTAGSSGRAAVNVCVITDTLKEAGACNNKLIGTALAQGSLLNNNYTTAAKEFNAVTPENEMKWDTVEPSQGNFNFAPGDTIVNFAKQNGMKVKGHTLVWHSQLPAWVSALSTADAVRGAMVNHITKVMTHFKGSIYAWDVVNEAWETPSKKGDGTATLRASVFKTKLGDGFIDEAFRAAKAADPDALLFYNDYSAEGMNDKSNAVYNMVKGMKERGVPIDGVGLQTHIGTPNDTPTPEEVKQNIDRLAALGLQVVISEMDVNGCDDYTADAIAKIYHDIVSACVSQPLCTAITFWGISDANSWLNTFGEAGCAGKSPTPLLWDSGYKKKAAYTSVVKALTGN
jgi:endo-1,4-beta-xylanase